MIYAARLRFGIKAKRQKAPRARRPDAARLRFGIKAKLVTLPWLRLEYAARLRFGIKAKPQARAREHYSMLPV